MLLKGGLGLPAGVARSLGAQRGQALQLAGGGELRPTRMQVLLGGGVLSSAAASPVAVAVLPTAQTLTGMPRPRQRGPDPPAPRRRSSRSPRS